MLTRDMNSLHLVKKLCVIAQEAGNEILAVKSDLNDDSIDFKVDGSPVTIADLRAHQTICSGISKLSPNTPIVSEEGSLGSPDDSNQCFLVDPLDGTKEFINGNGMYTVNISLVQRTENSRWKPILGVVVAPELETTWYGGANLNATRICKNSTREVKAGLRSKIPLVLGSLSHPSHKDGCFRDDLGEHIFEGVGSSIKICRVADGTADLTVRFGPTSCWDTAAAHAILNAAGGNLLGPNGKELDYDLVKDQLNPPFIATYDNKWVDVWIRHQV